MLSAKRNGDAPTLLSIVTLLVSVYTLYIAFCIYGQKLYSDSRVRCDQSEAYQVHSISGMKFPGDTDSGAPSRCVKHDAGAFTCKGRGSASHTARRCLEENQTESAVSYLTAALECNKTDTQALKTLSHIYVHALHTPVRAVEVLQPHYSNSNATEEGAFLREAELTCTYMQALVRDSATARTVLQLVERLQLEGITLDACMLSAHIGALYELKYYVDAYQVSMGFVQKHPELPASHAWMGQTLSALRRNEEGAAVLQVARTLIHEEERWNADLRLLQRLGDALYFVNASEAAADMYARALPAMQGIPALRDQRCEMLLRQGKLHLELNKTHAAYVELLQCIRDCPENPRATLYLGMAQHKVGLFHHATDTLKAALKHKSTKAEARAAIKAMKAEQEAMMAEQVRLAEEALGPKPPVDPTIERHQQNESYIDYMARVCKQQEEQESAEWERERRAKDLAAAAVKLETATVTVHPVEAGSTTSETSSPSNASEPNSDSSTPAESILATANAPTPVVDTSTDSAATMNLSEEEIAARNVADQFVIIAAAYTKKADYAQALKQLGKAIKRAPAYAAPYVQRGEVHMAMGSTALAVADFMKVCTELDKTDGATKSLLVQIAAELALAGKHSEAEVILAPLDAQLPIDETFCLNQAAAFVRQGDLQGAIRSLERMGDAALAASPQAQRLLAQLGASSGDTRTDGAASSVAEDVRLTVEQVAGSDAGSPNSATAGAPGGLHRRSRWVRHAADGAAAVAADGTAENVDVEPSATQL